MVENFSNYVLKLPLRQACAHYRARRCVPPHNTDPQQNTVTNEFRRNKLAKLNKFILVGYLMDTKPA